MTDKNVFCFSFKRWFLNLEKKKKPDLFPGKLRDICLGVGCLIASPGVPFTNMG